jgi:hypothetical protein
MDFNGNNQSLNHLINVRRRPATARAAQDVLNEQRLNRIQAILATRPHFSALKFSLPATNNITPVTQNTPDFRHDLIVTGAITNSNRPFEIERRNSKRPMIYIEADDYSTRFNLNEFAGEVVPSGGYNGIFYFPHPFVIGEGRFETFKVYKLDADPAEIAWLALVGMRVFADDYAEAQLTAQQAERVRAAIISRETPQTHYAKIAIEFDAGGKASFKTPKFEEPHILRGIKSTFNESLIRFGIEGEARLTSNPDEEGLGDYVPIWAVTAQTDSKRELYSWQQRGLFIDSNKRIFGELINTLDEGATTDNNGEITLILETM